MFSRLALEDQQSTIVVKITTGATGKYVFKVHIPVHISLYIKLLVVEQYLSTFTT